MHVETMHIALVIGSIAIAERRSLWANGNLSSVVELQEVAIYEKLTEKVTVAAAAVMVMIQRLMMVDSVMVICVNLQLADVSRSDRVATHEPSSR